MILFKPEHVDPILRGEKIQTSILVVFVEQDLTISRAITTGDTPYGCEIGFWRSTILGRAFLVEIIP